MEDKKNNVKFFFKKYKGIIIASLILTFFVAAFITFMVLKNNSLVVERFMRTSARSYASISSNISKYIPFSLTEVIFSIIIIAVIFVLVRVIYLFIKSHPKKATMYLLVSITVAFALFDFHLIAGGMSYNRAPLDLPFYTEKVEKEKYKDIYNYFVDDYNECVYNLSFKENGEVDPKMSFNEISKLVNESYKKNITSDYFSKVSVPAKRMFTSFFFRELQLTGVTFYPLAEANVNYMSTKIELPFVMAHEFAHVKGIGREELANQVAFYVLLNSDSYYLRFSAYELYLYQIRSLSSSYFMSKEDKDSLHVIANEYTLGGQYLNNYWKSHRALSAIGDFFNDIFIKSSGAKEGSDAYATGSDIVADDTTHELIANPYQQIFFRKYFG